MRFFELNAWQKRAYFSWICIPALIVICAFVYSNIFVQNRDPSSLIADGTIFVIFTFGLMLPIASVFLLTWILSLSIRKVSTIEFIKMIILGLCIQVLLIEIAWFLQVGFPSVSQFSFELMIAILLCVPLIIIQIVYSAVVFGLSRIHRLSMTLVLLLSGLILTSLIAIAWLIWRFVAR